MRASGARAAVGVMVAMVVVMVVTTLHRDEVRLAHAAQDRRFRRTVDPFPVRRRQRRQTEQTRTRFCQRKTIFHSYENSRRNEACKIDGDM